MKKLLFTSRQVSRCWDCKRSIISGAVVEPLCVTTPLQSHNTNSGMNNEGILFYHLAFGREPFNAVCIGSLTPMLTPQQPRGARETTHFVMFGHAYLGLNSWPCFSETYVLNHLAPQPTKPFQPLFHWRLTTLIYYEILFSLIQILSHHVMKSPKVPIFCLL